MSIFLVLDSSGTQLTEDLFDSARILKVLTSVFRASLEEGIYLQAGGKTTEEPRSRRRGKEASLLLLEPLNQSSALLPLLSKNTVRRHKGTGFL